jgi:hypothetical protein
LRVDRCDAEYLQVCGTPFHYLRLIRIIKKQCDFIWCEYLISTLLWLMFMKKGGGSSGNVKPKSFVGFSVALSRDVTQHIIDLYAKTI